MMNSCGHLRFLWLLPIVAAGGALAQSPPAAPKLTPLPHPDVPDPVDASQFSSPWLLIIFCAAAAVLFAIVIWMLFRKQNLKTRPKVPPLTLAHRRLLDLLDENENLDPSETGHRVSVIMRDYQMGRYAVPAPFRTREELYDMREFATDEERQERFASVALTCDEIAFAPAPATKTEAESLVKSAIETLHREVLPFESAVPD